MEIGKFFTAKKVAFIFVFASLAFLAGQINVATLQGGPKAQYFTAIEFFGPMAGGFLGAAAGAVAIILAKAGALALTGKAIAFIDVVRLLPMAVAAYYFANYSKKKDLSALVPVAAIAAWMLHPIGATVWYFALFWTIPVIAKAISTENLLLRSLGATFTAHAVGGVAWIYAFNSPAAVWNALIPVVAMERLVFAVGIAASFVVLNTILDAALKADVFKSIPGVLNAEPKYTLSALLGRK